MESRISGVNLARTITVISMLKHGGGNMFIWCCKTANGHLLMILRIYVYVLKYCKNDCQPRLVQQERGFITWQLAMCKNIFVLMSLSSVIFLYETKLYQTYHILGRHDCSVGRAALFKHEGERFDSKLSQATS